MSANPPILTVPPQARQPNEHIHRYLSSIRPHQPNYAREGERTFKNEQEHGFEEVASHWAKGDSSSAGIWSEVIMGRRARAGASPPRTTRAGKESERVLPSDKGLPTANQGENGIAGPSRRREVIQQQNEGYASETSSAERREQRKLRRREKAAIRRPPEPIYNATVAWRKRPASQRDESEISTSRSMLPLPRRRRGKGEADDVVRLSEASNVPVKRLTLKPGTTKGFLHRGAESVPAHPAMRNGSRRPPPLLRDESWEMSWRPTKAQRSTRPSKEYVIDNLLHLSTPPRSYPIRSIPNLHLETDKGFLRGHLPHPGRTNSTSWPSEMHSRSSRRDVGTLLSPEPVGTPLQENAISLSPPRPHSSQHPLTQVLVPSQPARPQVSPPSAFRYYPPEHVEKSSSNPTPALKLQSGTPKVLAPLSQSRQARDRKVSIHIIPDPSSATRSPIHNQLRRRETAVIPSSVCKPLIHPNFHDDTAKQPTSTKSKSRPFGILLSVPSPKCVVNTSVRVQERPHIRIEPVKDLDQSLPPNIRRPLESAGPVKIPDSPTIHPAIRPLPYLNSNHDREPLRSYTKLDVTQDNPFLSERNPFLASRQYPSQSYDSHLPYPSFSSPPPPILDIPLSNYSRDLYQEDDMYYTTEETGSLVQGHDFRDSTMEGDNNEDLRNFWKDRPAVL